MSKEYFRDYSEPEFLYQMLDRLRSDCEYFLEYGNGLEKNLWALTVDDQISAMKEIFNKLEEKPEWLNLEQIDKYEKEMKVKLSEKSIGKIFKQIYQDLREEILKQDTTIFIKEYEIPSRNYNSENLYLCLASEIKMELSQMMILFDNKVFVRDYKDKYFFSNSEQKAQEKILKEVERGILKEQKKTQSKKRNRDIR